MESECGKNKNVAHKPLGKCVTDVSYNKEVKKLTAISLFYAYVLH